jgi:CheY-like chemotaxis protein
VGNLLLSLCVTRPAGWFPVPARFIESADLSQSFNLGGARERADARDMDSEVPDMTIALDSRADNCRAPARPRRILIVEDQPEIGEMLAQILGPAGFQTFTATNGVEALDLAAALMPDVITLDLNLPMKDGQAVLDELAADARTAAIPVIVISAYTGRLHPTDQVIGILRKPFDIQELLDTIGVAVGAV